MNASDFAPAAMLGLFVTVAIAAAQLLPFGDATLLVRTRGSPVLVAGMAHAALMAVPAPGFAVLHGDAAEIRAALGLAVIWKGKAACSPPP